jgi:isoquinoline 1-oxidoreductase
MNALSDIEPERYELFEAYFAVEQNRREFFRIAGSGLIVALLASDESVAQPQRGGNAPREIGAWIHIAEDSAVTVYTGKVEIGQNIRTSLSQVVAEELHCPLKSIRVVMADTALVPFDAGTFGSGTTPRMASQLRRAAAAARETLVDLAAKQSKVERNALVAADGKVSGQGGKPVFTFGELTKGQRLMKVIEAAVPTASAKSWTVAGTSVEKVDGHVLLRSIQIGIRQCKTCVAFAVRVDRYALGPFLFAPAVHLADFVEQRFAQKTTFGLSVNLPGETQDRQHQKNNLFGSHKELGRSV